MIAAPGSVILTRTGDGKRWYLTVRSRWSTDPTEAWPFVEEVAAGHMRRLFGSLAWRTHDDINISVQGAKNV